MSKTPEEQAKELIRKFRIFLGTYDLDDGGTSNNYLLGKHQAKAAAIIHVEGIIEFMKEDDKHNKDCSNLNGYWFNHYQQVLTILKQQ